MYIWRRAYIFWGSPQVPGVPGYLKTPVMSYFQGVIDLFRWVTTWVSRLVHPRSRSACSASIWVLSYTLTEQRRIIRLHERAIWSIISFPRFCNALVQNNKFVQANICFHIGFEETSLARGDFFGTMHGILYIDEKMAIFHTVCD